VIDVEVVGEPGMGLARAEVGTDGRILHPLLGSLQVAGQTLESFRRDLERVLAEDYLVDPKVRVRLVESARKFFAISNQVHRPGTYSWPRGENLTLLRAIGMAGGATRRAALSRVVVRRWVEGRRQEVVVNLLAGEPSGDKPFELQSGDEVELLGR
jgi:protein involved in polysaccharide export with SLBB domain